MEWIGCKNLTKRQEYIIIYQESPDKDKKRFKKFERGELNEIILGDWFYND